MLRRRFVNEPEADKYLRVGLAKAGTYRKGCWENESRPDHLAAIGVLLRGGAAGGIGARTAGEDAGVLRRRQELTDPESTSTSRRTDLKTCIETATNVPRVKTRIYLDAWPQDPRELDAAATIVLMWEGWDKHLVNRRSGERVQKLDQLMKPASGCLLPPATAVENDVEHY